MSAPKHFVRRAGLVAWLVEKGFTAREVADLIRAGIIPQRHFPKVPRGGKSRSKVKTGQHPKLTNVRAWYHTRDIAIILKIDL